MLKVCSNFAHKCNRTTALCICPEVPQDYIACVFKKICSNLAQDYLCKTIALRISSIFANILPQNSTRHTALRIYHLPKFCSKFAQQEFYKTIALRILSNFAKILPQNSTRHSLAYLSLAQILPKLCPKIPQDYSLAFLSNFSQSLPNQNSTRL